MPAQHLVYQNAPCIPFDISMSVQTSARPCESRLLVGAKVTRSGECPDQPCRSTPSSPSAPSRSAAVGEASGIPASSRRAPAPWQIPCEHRAARVCRKGEAGAATAPRQNRFQIPALKLLSSLHCN